MGCYDSKEGIDHADVVPEGRLHSWSVALMIDRGPARASLTYVQLTFILQSSASYL